MNPPLKTFPRNGDYLGLKNIGSLLKTRPCEGYYGKVSYLIGNMIEAEGINAAVGDICKIFPSFGGAPIYAEVVGFDQRRLKLSPLTHINGIMPGCLVQLDERSDFISVGPFLLGRVMDGFGEPIDGGGDFPSGVRYPLSGKSTNPQQRPLIGEQLDLGIRCFNTLLPVGKGQRIGIFAGSGVGKSTLLGMMARYTSAPVNVIALIGERGREVNEFIQNDLGPDGLKRSVIIVATSDQPATVRMRAAFMACAVAEYFRDLGEDVVLMMDSATRFAMAAREIGLAAGEPPTTKGYTPSVFSQLPRLLERAGNFEIGSITGIYTVLVEGDDMEDPIADSLRAILDGHVVLDRRLAQNRHYPAIEVLRSVSRLTNRLLDDRQKELCAKLLQTLSLYKNSEDMIRIGAYVRGTHSETDYAIAMIDKINDFLRQPVEESCSIAKARSELDSLIG